MQYDVQYVYTSSYILAAGWLVVVVQKGSRYIQLCSVASTRTIAADM